MPVVIPSLASSWTYTFSPYPSPWPFSPGVTPPQTCIDTVRFLIGDVNSADPQIADGEVSGLLIQNNGDPYQSAIEACRSLAARYARQADKAVGDLHISASQRAKAYLALIASLRTQSLRFATPRPYAGGISVMDKENNRDDDDLVNPEFFKGMDDDRSTATTFGDFPNLSRFEP